MTQKPYYVLRDLYGVKVPQNLIDGCYNASEFACNFAKKLGKDKRWGIRKVKAFVKKVSPDADLSRSDDILMNDMMFIGFCESLDTIAWIESKELIYAYWDELHYNGIYNEEEERFYED